MHRTSALRLKQAGLSRARPDRNQPLDATSRLDSHAETLMKCQWEMLQRSGGAPGGLFISTRLLLGEREAVGHPEPWPRVFYCGVSDSAQRLHEAGITPRPRQPLSPSEHVTHHFTHYCPDKGFLHCVASTSRQEFSVG